MGQPSKKMLADVAGYSNTGSKTFKDEFNDLLRSDVIRAFKDDRFELTEKGISGISGADHPVPKQKTEHYSRMIKVLCTVMNLQLDKLRLVWSVLSFE